MILNYQDFQTYFKTEKLNLILFCLFAFLSWPLLAQKEPENEEDPTIEMEIQTVTVTAEKRQSSLQETPIALTVIGSEDIENHSVGDLREIAKITPGLEIGGNSGFEHAISMRGISSAVSGLGADVPVAIYVDGVYLGRPGGAVFEFTNIERVEVLRGPQGTLYGRNATGGAINIITKDPGERLGAELKGSYGRFAEKRVSAEISGPLIQEKLFLSVSGSSLDRDGWADNLIDDRKLNGSKMHTVNAALLYKPNDRTSLTLRADESRNKWILVGKDIGPLAATSPDDYDLFATNEEPFNEPSQWGTSLTVDHRFDTVTARSITAYRKSDQEYFFDSDSGPQQIIRLHVHENSHHQFSQEFQLFNNETSRLIWLAGLYFFEESSKSLIQIHRFAANDSVGIFPANRTESYAGFAQATYNLTDRTNLTGGLRFSQESKDFENSPGNLGPLEGTVEPSTIVEQSDDWNDWSPKLVLEHHASSESMFYLSVTQGFKSGGFNFLSNDPSFEPETITAYELGLKSNWMKRIRLNATAFVYDYTDLQVRIPGEPGQIFIQNAAEADVSGIELESEFRPVRGWRLQASASYLDAEYADYKRAIRDASGDEVVDESGNILFEDLSGNVLNRAPEWMFAFSSEYLFPGISWGSSSLFFSYQYKSESFFTETNDPVMSRGAWHNIDARLNLTLLNGVGLSAYGKNLGDDRFYNSIIPIGPWRSATANDPRIFGLELSYKY